jgi:hypothetical protein
MGVKMFKKIRLLKKFLKIVDGVESFWDGNKEKLEKAKEVLPEIKGYITDLERLLAKVRK